MVGLLTVGNGCGSGGHDDYFLFILVTSSAVKKKLQNFVLNKQQRELAVASLTNDSAFKHW